MTVQLFSILERVFSDHKLEYEIEPNCKKPNGSECTPDILVKENEFKTIIEHKASLSENEMSVRGVLEEIYNKYVPLISGKLDGQIAALFPEEDETTVQLIMHLITDNLVFSSFMLQRDPKLLKLSTIKGEYSSPKLMRIMSTNFEYDFTEFARYKLIRMKPPVPLAADIIWNLVLLPLYGASGKFGNEVTIDYQDILSETITQVRGYGETPDDNLRSVVNKSLKFLNKLGWVEFNGQDLPVKVFPKKGTGMGQIRQLFCNKWFQLKVQGKIDLDMDSEDNGSIQLSLDDC